MDRITISGAVAGAQGSPYRKILPYIGKAAASYTFTEANFAGLGVFLPCWAVLAFNGQAGCTVTLQITNDGGTTWFTLCTSAAAGQVGQYVYLDTAATLRVTFAGGLGDTRIFVM